MERLSIRELDSDHAELKSMHTASHLLQGERDRQSDGFSFAGAGQAERILSSESRDRHQ